MRLAKPISAVPSECADVSPSAGTVNRLKAVFLIAVTYFHFLIFAQFAFLARLATWTSHPAALKSAMAAMALGGVICSWLAAGPALRLTPQLRLRISLAVSAIAAFLSILSLNLPCAIALGFLIGAGLAGLTVTLASELGSWLGRSPWLLIGLGCGAGYWLANLPLIFTASAQTQAALSGSFCLVACVFLPRSISDWTAEEISVPANPWFLLTCFFALVWLDSAAFYIIQHVPALKAGTWQGDAHLWINGALHLVAALAAAWMLKHLRAEWTLGLAFLFLAIACVLLQFSWLAVTASAFYPCGVSLYSVALVAFPSLLARAQSTQQRARMAGWLYAIAGWIGSGLGIGMGENLHRIPLAFLVVSGAVLLFPVYQWLLRKRTRELLAVATLACICLALPAARNPVDAGLTAAERGRAVYIAEGCIHCHSQYVRPGTMDVLLWGPTRSLAAVHQEVPPLIGNRRQGPDLSMVGSRRTSAWIRMHMIAPAQVTPGSSMPSYAVLFHDGRGEDMVTWLTSLHANDAALDEQRANWSVSAAAKQQANPARGQQLYQLYCVQCHARNAPLFAAWPSKPKHAPVDYLNTPPVPSGTNHPSASTEQLARILKFGLPHTEMPGHELLNDEEIWSLVLWLTPRIQPTSLTPAIKE